DPDPADIDSSAHRCGPSHDRTGSRTAADAAGATEGVRTRSAADAAGAAHHATGARPDRAAHAPAGHSGAPEHRARTAQHESVHRTGRAGAVTAGAGPTAGRSVTARHAAAPRPGVALRGATGRHGS